MSTPSSSAKKKKKKKANRQSSGGDEPRSAVASPAGTPASTTCSPSRSDWVSNGVALVSVTEENNPATRNDHGLSLGNYKHGVVAMNPRTMEAAGFSLAEPVMLLKSDHEIAHVNASSKEDRFELASNLYNIDDGSPPNYKIVACLCVWPSTSLHPRKVRLPLGSPDSNYLREGADVRIVGVVQRQVKSVSINYEEERSDVDVLSSGDNRAQFIRLLKAKLNDRWIFVGLTLTTSFGGVIVKTTVSSVEWLDLGSAGNENCCGRVVSSTPISIHKPKGDTSESTSDESTLLSTGQVTYDSIGGLDEQLQIIRDTIELPLRRSELFRKFHIRPPSGVLLVGPPGTGKTLIAKACAAASGCHNQFINGPEVISKFYGETERRLREIFTCARDNAPSIIFIDEIDALCPAREKAPNELEKRIVASMLTLMDGINSKDNSHGNILVIGATNRPNALDSAIRRPGRFDREIEIGVPNANGRCKILSALLRNTPNNLTATDLDSVAAVAHGYVGADLAAVCNEAGLLATQRALKQTGFNIESESFHELSITIDDLRAGLERVTPSAMREVYVDVPNVRWSDIGGQEDTKQQLKEAVEWPLKHPEAFTRMGIRPPRGVLLYGPPGCSKTLMAKALATETSLNFLAVKGPELFSKWVGESEKAVRTVFKKARMAAPSIIFFDEIDALAGQREEGNSKAQGVGERVLSQLLAEMDGVEELANVTVVAATNRPDMIDPALLRPGRMDRKIYVGPPDEAARKQIFERHIAEMPFESSVDVDQLAANTAGHSGAEIVAICREAALQSMKSNPRDPCNVSMFHFEEALKNTSKNITQEMLDFYDGYKRGKKVK